MISPSKPQMSPERFIEYIQNCFNDRFHDDMKKTMRGYLSEMDPMFISCLARVVLLRHPRQYRCAPGLAELEKYQEEAGQEYARLKQDLTIPAIEDGKELSAEEEAQISEALDKLRAKFYS